MTDAYSVGQILGNRIAQTPPSGDNSQRVSTTAFVATAIANATRTKLAAATTVFVSNSGSDSNTGATASKPFATIQAAYNYVANNFDFNGQTVTIKCASGQTITNALLVTSAWVGGGSLVLDLGTSTWNVTSNSCLSIFDAALPAYFTVQNGTMETTTSGNCITIEGSGVNVQIGTGITFGACAGAHMVCQVNAHMELPNNYTINSGGAGEHFISQFGGMMAWNGPTVTVTGTPAFTLFADVLSAQALFFNGATFTGGATTALRYSVTANGVLNTNNGGTTFFPGNTAGTALTGGLYL